MAYTAHEAPAVVRGRVSQFEDLRVYLPVTLRTDYDGSLGVRTKPPLKLSVDETLVLESPLGCVAIDAAEANNLERWLSASLRRGDRLGVLCLPGAWQPDASQAQEVARNGHAIAASGEPRAVQPAPSLSARDAALRAPARN